MDWSPVMDVKHRSDHKKVRRRQIPRNANVIRKKNAKYEIPPGETLENIDQLIAEAHGRGDKKAVIRLIGNKRLLRNRLAALESRERKKRYIEKLEKDNKQLSDELNSTKEDLDRALEKINHLERQAAHLKIVIEKIR
ncbi:putative bzip transcription factor [Erysiphe necator]|uniref:Putative bzip transcription factor n=1 Tax=Uncinula necator TaxID=52586 RepID=A0A0B1P125_UNCNE|nr:putative bzip transcription factor [Erysiphe necator]